ncbi:hypothetical protein [Magnetospira sp. QH-2]|uniref:hypothetical protein n=1 Tax=Magnetospira sp. (strain QH-2) TaxID=1288970 RepID=UPI0003E814A1|nr:hypothetical protein [Magnetospira sp. QH-2]CCQ72421.1 conserved protein of unknown function [Magnetospira sp. QH-2]
MAKKKVNSEECLGVLRIPEQPGKSRQRVSAEVSTSPETLSAITARIFTQVGMGPLDLTECVEAMKDKGVAVRSGDLSEAEATLAAQAVALDAIFHEMARRSALNMGQHLSAAETYMRLALKAQGQCRTTLQALAEIKNPHPVAFVKQANIAHGPQQVNNGVSTDRRGPARAEQFETEQSKLLEKSGDGERMDPGTACAAGRSNQEMATVGKIKRT